MAIGSSCYADVYYVQNVDTTINNPQPVEGINYFLLDINDDDIIDYKIGARYFLSHEGIHSPYDAFEVFVWGESNNTVSAGPYQLDDSIDSTLYYERSDVLVGRLPEYGIIGAWAVSQDFIDSYLFVGLRVEINSQFHYGWLEIKTDGLSFTLMSYAFNDQADQPIIITQSY